MPSWCSDTSAFEAHPIVAAAARYAFNLNHGFVGTEHLLLGALECGGADNQHIRSRGLDPARAFEAVREFVGEGDRQTRIGTLPLTPDAKKILVKTTSLADPEMGWRQLLLAIHEAEPCVGSSILRSFKVDAKELEAF